MMGRDPKYWLMVGFFMVAGLIWVQFRPQSREGHRIIAEQLFHLPDAAHFTMFRSGEGDWGSEYIEGVVQFTPSQFDTYIAGLDDPAVWGLVPFEFNDLIAIAEPMPDAMRWWPADGAILRGENVASWAGWGWGHSENNLGDDSVGKVGEHLSFCYGISGLDRDQIIAPCTHFERFTRPAVYVRGMIDVEGKRLFLYVR